MSDDGRAPAGPHLVLGMGRAGRSAAEALGPQGVCVWDAHDGPETRRREPALRARGARVVLGPWRRQLLEEIEPGTVVKSPGVPAAAAPVRDARDAGLPVIDELELGRRLMRRRLVAVTGTDGKSTTSALIAAMLGPGVPVAGNTEFGPPLSACPPAGGPVVVEVSSYQLEFSAPAFPDLAVLTNLTEEHLHRHGSMAGYAAVKRRLFLGAGRAVPLAVVNTGQAFGRDLSDELEAGGTTVARVGWEAGDPYRVLDARSHRGGARLRVLAAGRELVVETRLPGRHNAENALAALAAADLLGVPRTASVAALAGFGGVPGRWERMAPGRPVEVVVDFAHTPAGLRAALGTARELVGPAGRVTVVVSAGGATTPGKRGPLGATAGTHADRVVVTEAGLGGDPREHVIGALVAGAAGTPADLDVVPDRRAAIRAALAGARPGDLVLVADRGARPRFVTDPAGGGVPWDDRLVVAEELARLP